MKTLITTSMSLAFISLLSACASPQFIETTTGTNLLETNSPVYTLVNLHPDMNNLRMYTVNYQQGGLIHRCSPVKLDSFDKKKLIFKDLADDRIYTLIKHGSSPDFPGYLNKYFGTTCDTDKVDTLSNLDKKGIASGKAFVGMSKDGVILAIGYPPEHKTPSLKGDSWLYWSSRWDRFIIFFDKNGLVTSIKD